MNLNLDEFASLYARLDEPELVELARSYDSLIEPAQAAMREEFRRRGLEPPMIEESDGVRQTLVTVRRYRDLSEAIVARSLLESAGIDVSLQDENLVRLDWQVSDFIGGIRLQVDAPHAAAATLLLDQPVVDPIREEGQADFDQPHCPRCGSNEITFEGSSRGAALTSLFLLSVPLPLGRKTWRRNSCGVRWWDDEENSDSDGAESN
jgi:hypothetical protein